MRVCIAANTHPPSAISPRTSANVSSATSAATSQSRCVNVAGFALRAAAPASASATSRFKEACSAPASCSSSSIAAGSGPRGRPGPHTQRHNHAASPCAGHRSPRGDAGCPSRRGPRGRMLHGKDRHQAGSRPEQLLRLVNITGEPQGGCRPLVKRAAAARSRSRWLVRNRDTTMCVPAKDKHIYVHCLASIP